MLKSTLDFKNEPVLQRQGVSPARRAGGSCPVTRGPANAALTCSVPGGNGGEQQVISALEASGIAFLWAYI